MIFFRPLNAYGSLQDFVFGVEVNVVMDVVNDLWNGNKEEG